jgi:hypothetical protein
MVRFNLIIGTILVNPWNVEAFAELIHEAIRRVERGDKMNIELIKYIEKNTSFEWCSKFLYHLKLPISSENLYQTKKSPIIMKHLSHNDIMIEIEYIPENYIPILNIIDTLVAKHSKSNLNIKLRAASDNPVISLLDERNLKFELISEKREVFEKDLSNLTAELLTQYSEMYDDITVENFPDAGILDFSNKDEEFKEFQIAEISSNLVKFFSSFPVEIIKRNSYIIIKSEGRTELMSLKRIEYVPLNY